jgi:hypothetical protein
VSLKESSAHCYVKIIGPVKERFAKRKELAGIVADGAKDAGLWRENGRVYECYLIEKEPNQIKRRAKQSGIPEGGPGFRIARADVSCRIFHHPVSADDDPNGQSWPGQRMGNCYELA